MFACSGVSIRCIKEAHHVVIDKGFPSKFYFKKTKCPRMVNGVELTGLGTIHYLSLNASTDRVASTHAVIAETTRRNRAGRVLGKYSLKFSLDILV